jgi:purine-binding chemotaxis protein CheW
MSTALAKKAIAASTEDSRRWVSFYLANAQYAVDVLRVQEVLQPGQIEPVPGAPAAVLGIINLRGNIVTVVSARRLLDLEEQPSDSETRVIIVNCAADPVGIKVDGVADVIQLPANEIDPAPRVDGTGRPSYVYGVATCGERLTIFIDLDKLLAGAES